jgi:glycosyltransferase involved in cell wall biosynthesis
VTTAATPTTPYLANRSASEGEMRTSGSQSVAIVIPCFRVRQHILQVLSEIGPCVDAIYVVDDGCPESTGTFVSAHCTDPRVRVIFHETNQGVGGAVMTGISTAIKDGMEIIIKLDGDGQMDPALVPRFVAPICAGQADFTKGNRFFNPDDVKAMPVIRVVGNAGLSFFAKLSSGYWNVFDPTNGFIGADARLLSALPFDKISKRFFFESDLLFRVGLARAKVMDIPMVARYGTEQSNLKIHRELPRFFWLNLRNAGKRIFYNYFLRDFNIASLELVFGVLLIAFGAIYGITQRGGEEAAPPGIVMMAAFPLLTGIILLLNFVNFDVQQVPRETISSHLE